MKLKGVGNKAKLTWEKVSEIRKRYDNGKGETQQMLAKEFDISQAVISSIVNYRTWKDVALVDHENQLTDHETRLADQAHTIGALKSKVTKLEQRIDRQEKMITSLQNRVTELESK
jgi:uncharacterized coiled-coil protein SlyX